MKPKKFTLSLLTATLLAHTLHAETLDPIVISSDFRQSTLSHTIGSVSVIDEEKIAQQSDDAIENILTKSPNLNFTSGASRAHYIQIRGIGERSQFINPVNPSVGIILDGIDLSQSALALTPFDLAQIEVLRGPQGTQFGTNGLAGVISAHSVAPSKQPSFHTEMTLGNYNKEAWGFAGGGTIIKDKLLGRLSLYKNTSDGFMQNSYLHRKNTSNIDELTLKGALRWLLNDRHSIDLHLLHLDVDNGYDDFTLDNSRISHADEPGFDRQKTDAFSLESTYQLSPKAHLETTISAQTNDIDYGYDEDWSYKGEFADDLGPYSSTDRYKRDRKQWDADMRILSDKGGEIFNATTAWTAGIYYKDFSEDLKRIYTYLDHPFTSNYDTTNSAIYGQLDTALNHALTLTTGLRLEQWDADYDDSDKMKINTDKLLTGGKIGLKYQINPHNLYYISLSKGYKPGGVNPNSDLPDNARHFSTESLYNLDVGMHAKYLEGKLTHHLNLFYGKRRDQQVKSSLVKAREDGSSEFIDFIANAAKTHYYGLESTLDYRPIEALHLYSSLGLLKSKFDRYTDPNPKSLNVNGRTPAQSPKYQYDIGIDYFWNHNIKLSTDLEGKGSYYFSNRHNAKAPAYALFNASVTMFADAWNFRFWGRNLLDREYLVRGFGSFGNNPIKGYAVETYTQKGDPKTYGLTVSYDY